MKRKVVTVERERIKVVRRGEGIHTVQELFDIQRIALIPLRGLFVCHKRLIYLNIHMREM